MHEEGTAALEGVEELGWRGGLRTHREKALDYEEKLRSLRDTFAAEFQAEKAAGATPSQLAALLSE